jgi:lipopolysaccharide export system permease protein
MRLSWTLTRYLAVQFVSAVAIVLAGFLVVVFIFDFIAMLQRFGTKPGITFATVMSMSLLKMPSLLEDTIPFATLAGATWSFASMSRSSELVVARAAGVSAWQFLAPAVVIAFVSGLFLIMAYDPLAALMIEREEGLESKFLRIQTSLLDVSSTGLWLRQMDNQGASIINAQRVSNKGTRLDDVTFYMFQGQDSFVGLASAKVATLAPGHWALSGGLIRRADSENQPQPIDSYPTSLTRSQIQDSFASPKTMSFWQLPRFIRLAEQAGFSALRHRLHYYSMLATPLLLCAMTLLAAAFALRVQRGQGLNLIVVGAIMTGFLLYAASSFCNALGLAGVVPVTLAAWAPAATATLLGVAFLLHFEDG